MSPCKDVLDTERAFENFCLNRLDGWAREKTESSQEFQDAKKDYAYCYRQIEARLGEDKGLLEKLDSLKNSVYACYDMPNYLQGWRDCLSLLQRLELF